VTALAVVSKGTVSSEFSGEQTFAIMFYVRKSARRRQKRGSFGRGFGLDPFLGYGSWQGPGLKKCYDLGIKAFFGRDRLSRDLKEIRTSGPHGCGFLAWCG